MAIGRKKPLPHATMSWPVLLALAAQYCARLTLLLFIWKYGKSLSKEDKETIGTAIMVSENKAVMVGVRL